MSCEKVQSIPPEFPEEVMDTIPYIWKVPYSSIARAEGSIDPVIYDNKVLISDRRIFEYEILKMFDGLTGELLWEWNDYISGSGNISNGIDLPVKENQLFFTANFREIYALNLENGQVDWKYLEEESTNSYPRISLFNDYLYYNVGQVGPDPSPFDSIIHLVRTPVDGFTQWDTVYTEIEGGDKLPRFIHPQGYKNDKGEEIIVFVYDLADINATLGEAYFLAYNLTQDTLVYRTGSWDRLASVRLPLIHEDRAFIALQRTFNCFDLATGELIWKQEFDGGINNLITAEYEVYEGTVIVKMSNNDLYAFKISDGSIVWHIPNAGIVASRLKIYDGIVYYVGDKLRAVKASTGEVIWAYDSSFAPHFDGHGVGINPDLGYLYTTDGVYLYAIPLIEG